jgi:hypothetical protein
MHWACRAQDVPNAMRAPVLLLDGTGEGPVNHAACMSSVAPRYAPPGQALIDLSIVDLPREPESMERLVARVRAQMRKRQRDGRPAVHHGVLAAQNYFGACGAFCELHDVSVNRDGRPLGCIPSLGRIHFSREAAKLRRTRSTRRNLNFVAEEPSSSEGTEKS